MSLALICDCIVDSFYTSFQISAQGLCLSYTRSTNPEKMFMLWRAPHFFIASYGEIYADNGKGLRMREKTAKTVIFSGENSISLNKIPNVCNNSSKLILFSKF